MLPVRLPVRLIVISLLLSGAIAALIAEHFVSAQNPTVYSALLSGNRSRLSVCVQGEKGATVSAAEVGAVQNALNELQASTLGRPEFGTPEASLGCPPSATLAGEPPRNASERHEALERVQLIWVPDEPSLHRVFLYFVPASVYAEYFGDAPYTRGAAEMLCKGDECWEVTSTLFLPESASENVLAEGIAYALGLAIDENKPRSTPTSEWLACEQGAPAPWCERYEEWRQIEQDMSK